LTSTNNKAKGKASSKALRHRGSIRPEMRGQATNKGIKIHTTIDEAAV
jgi:hypothetical protein